MKKRKILSILLLIILLIFFELIASAHPGSLDENGGHYNRTTGEYHYHDGIHTDGDPSGNNFAFYLFLASCGFVFVTALFIWHKITETKRRRLQKQKEEDAKKEFERIRMIHYEMYANKDILSLCNCPEGTYIGDDGFPKTDGDGEYGIYTVYVVGCGKKYHLKEKCGGHLMISTNIVRHPELEPCMRCAWGHSIDISWYKEYKRILSIKEKYNIT